ncbi:MAG TPA: AMP-binding protein [Burkholderiaceae bacterium]|nr:AMP-binding protein [Burkholderiaceae bacterium]
MNPTVHFDGSVLPAAAFHARCLRSAAALLELGVGPGDAVALMLHNEPLMFELMLATRWLERKLREPYWAGRDRRV